MNKRDGIPIQAIKATSVLHVECKQIRRLDEFEKAAKDVQRHVFDIAHGETARLVLLSRSPKEHYLILGFFKLILDGISFQALLKSLQNYSQIHALPEIAKLSQCSGMERKDLSSGTMATELGDWKDNFVEACPPLPILDLSSAPNRPSLSTCEPTRATLRIFPDTRAKILEVCRRFRATPFHCYVATLRALLLRHGQG